MTGCTCFAVVQQIAAISQRAAQDIADRLIADLIPQIGQRPTMRS
jgi:DNA-binding FrmR family transcriptional regulator